MEPQYRAFRRKAIYRFLGLFACSLLLVLIGSYFLFNTPAQIYKEKIQSYKHSEVEQSQLLTRVSGVTSDINQLVDGDKNFLNSANDLEKQNFETKINEYKANIITGVSAIKNDSAVSSSSEVKAYAHHYSSSYNTILLYYNVICDLRNQILQKGGDAAELLKVKEDLRACKADLDNAKLLSMLNNKPAQAQPQPGGGASKASADKINELEEEVKKYKKQADDCTQQLNAKSAEPVTQSPVAGPLTKTQVSGVLSNTAFQIYNQANTLKLNTIEQKSYLACAKEVFLAAKEKDDNQRIEDMLTKITAQISKLKGSN
jgi:hypothetical protein